MNKILIKRMREKFFKTLVFLLLINFNYTSAMQQDSTNKHERYETIEISRKKGRLEIQRPQAHMNRSKKVFFVSECILNQNIRAYGVTNVVGEGPLKQVIEILLHNGIGIHSISCPEIQYEGLQRRACGKCHYQNDEYRKICVQAAENLILRYKQYLADGYKVCGFICVNGSPSCAIDFCWGRGGKIFESGIFIEAILNKLHEENLTLRFIGVDVRRMDLTLQNINMAISHACGARG